MATETGEEAGVAVVYYHGEFVALVPHLVRLGAKKSTGPKEGRLLESTCEIDE